MSKVGNNIDYFPTCAWGYERVCLCLHMFVIMSVYLKACMLCVDNIAPKHEHTKTNKTVNTAINSTVMTNAILLSVISDSCASVNESSS